jgi:hypothetical protein
MNRLLALFLLPAMAWGQAGILTAPYVVPDRRADYGPDAFLLQPKMAQAVYKDSVLWLTAESPVLNEGTTGAQWICYAKTCSGNAVQTDTGRQPARVFTNGAWAWLFDGVDDRINLPAVTIGTNDFLATVDIVVPFGETSIDYGEIFACMFYATANPRARFAISKGVGASTNNVRWAFSTAGGGAYLAVGNYGTLTSGTHTLGVWRIKGQCGSYLNGVYSGTTANTIDYGTIPDGELRIGQYTRAFPGSVLNVKIFVGDLTK